MSLVTVGIPTRNRKDYLALAVESALTQTYKEIEVLVSDNASTDDTLRYLHGIDDSRLVVLEQQTNMGMAGTMPASTGQPASTF